MKVSRGGSVEVILWKERSCWRSLRRARKRAQPFASFPFFPQTASTSSCSILQTQPKMPSSTCFPFFDLPFELQNCILRFCGRADFAKVGRISRAFLELSSSYLYQDVHIEGFAQLMLLFCRRVSSRSSPEIYCLSS